MRRLFALVCMAFFWSVGSAQDVAAQNLVITNARIIVGNGDVIERGSIVVQDGRVVSVSPGNASAQGAQTIDAGGMSAMPGFIDGHRHIMRGEAEQWLSEGGADNMREFLEAGFTTLMSGGGPVPGSVDLKRIIESGEVAGPRIISSGRADPSNFPTPEEARAQVRILADAGVEIIKVRIDPDFSEQIGILAAVTDEADKVGLDVMVHAVSPDSMIAAVDAGADKLVHTPHYNWLTDEQAQKVADAGIENLSVIGFGAPHFDIFNDDNVPTFRDGRSWPDSILGGQGRGREAGYDAVNARTLWDNGVTYGFGTDTGFLPRKGLEHELRSLSHMFSPQDLVRLMGPNTAAFVNMSDEIGTLEAGKLADIILLDGNPLEGYWNFLNVRLTIKEGEIVSDQR